MRWILIGVAGLVAIVAVVAVIVVATDGDGDGVNGQRAGFTGQGGEGPDLASDGASLVRDTDGVRVRAVVPTPSPGSYEYPAADQVAKWATPHPDVSPGSAAEPEAFTMWLIAFNFPELCTDDSCDVDDTFPEAAAKGGVFQADGRIADDDNMELAGSVRLGQEPETGSLLENPLEAEVHLAIAPHGKALPGADGWRQLNGPVGNPTLWWSATFSPE